MGGCRGWTSTRKRCCGRIADVAEKCGERLKCSNLAGRGGCKGRTGGWVGERVVNVNTAREDQIGGRCNWHWDLGSAGVEHPDGVTAVGVMGRAHIPAVVKCMGRPFAAGGGLVMHKDTDAGRCYAGGAIEIEWTMEL